MKSVCFLGLALIVGVMAGGCSDPPIMHDLSGQITLDGQAVSNGQIYFVADKEKGNDGPSLNVAITRGRCTTAQAGRMAPVGPTRVRIEMYVDGSMYQYETTAELPPSPGTKDFVVAKANTKRVQPLAAPSMGGGGGKGKGKAKEKKDPDAEKKKEPSEDKP